MKVTWLIAFTTMRELLRERLLYSLVFFALLVIGSAVMLSRLTVGDADRIVVDLGLASINLSGVAMAVFVGITLVNREVDRRTVYLILAKPVPRALLVVGKYVGLCLTLVLNIGVMAGWFLAVLHVMGMAMTPALVQALYTIFLECAVVAAVAVLFSTLTTPTLGAMCTIALYVIGHSAPTLQAVGRKAGGQSEYLLTAAIYLFPNLELFNLKSVVFAPRPVATWHLSLLTAYAAAYSLCLLAIAFAVFQRKDLV